MTFLFYTLGGLYNFYDIILSTEAIKLFYLCVAAPVEFVNEFNLQLLIFPSFYYLLLLGKKSAKLYFKSFHAQNNLPTTHAARHHNLKMDCLKA